MPPVRFLGARTEPSTYTILTAPQGTVYGTISTRRDLQSNCVLEGPEVETVNHRHEWPLPGQAGVLQLSLEHFSHLFCLAGSQRRLSLQSNTAGKVNSILVRIQVEPAGSRSRGPSFIETANLMSARRMQQGRSGDRISGRPQMMSIMSPGMGCHLGNRPSDSASRKLLQRIISAGRALCKAIHSSLLCHGVVPYPRLFFAGNAAAARVKPTPVMS